MDQDLLLEYFLAADRGHHLGASGLQCDDFYDSCKLPEMSIKNALRDLVGIQYDEVIDTNSLGDGNMPLTSDKSIEDSQSTTLLENVHSTTLNSIRYRTTDES